FSSRRRHTRFDCDWSSDVCSSDLPVRLERVLANLLSNALKYSPDGGDVLVEIRDAGGWVELSVRDHGLGIPVADVARIFDPFHRDRKSTRLNSSHSQISYAVFCLK